MINDMIDIWLRKVVIWFAFALIFTGLGYLWAYTALGFEIYQPQPAHCVASDAIKTAMQKMGPRHDYRMVGESLYVFVNGQWLRLRYQRPEAVRFR